jgi:hypothetical protein
MFTCDVAHFCTYILARLCVFLHIHAEMIRILVKVHAMTRPLLILIAGPYRSGTNDDPSQMAANLARLEEAAWPLFQKGHVPVIGEWVALPIWTAAGGRTVGDELYEEVLYPTAGRLLAHCDGVLRLPGASKGADSDVSIARERGIPVWFSLDEVPRVA